MTRMPTVEEQAAFTESYAQALERLDQANRAADPGEAVERLHALIELSRLDTQSLNHFAAFVLSAEP